MNSTPTQIQGRAQNQCAREVSARLPHQHNGAALPLGSRFEVHGEHWVNPSLKSLAGPFQDELWRAKLSPTQLDLARWLCVLTLKQGRQRVIFETLDEVGQFLKLPKSRVHPVIFGEWKENLPNGVWSPGLAQDYAPGGHVKKQLNCRIFSFEELAEDSKVRWLVTVWPSSEAWNVDWRWSPAELASAVGALMVRPGSITPYVVGMAPIADLKDGLAAQGVDEALARGSAHGAGTADRPRSGALRDTPERTQRAMGARCGSGKGNAELQERRAFREGVPEKGTAPVNSITGNRELTVQQLNSYGSGFENRLLAEIKAQFARAHGAEKAAREMENYGGAWRELARLHGRTLAASVGELKCKNDARERFHCGAWHWLRSDVFRCLGVTTQAEAREKASKTPVKSKESLTAHYSAR